MGSDHISDNFEMFDFELSGEEMGQIGEKDMGHSEIINHFAPELVKALNRRKIHE